MTTRKMGILCLLLSLALLAGCVSTAQQVQQPSQGTTIPATAEPITEPTQPPTEPEPTAPPTEPPTEPVTEPEPTHPPTPVLPPEDPNVPYIGATQAFVYDCGSDSYIYIKGSPEDSVIPASTTKLMTAIVALKVLDPKEMITAGNELYYMDPDSSLSNLLIGNTMAVEDLIKWMLMPSGCDAAYTLAANAGWRLLGDPEAQPWEALAAFVEEMNVTAEEMGLLNTHFVTPDGGYRQDHYISLQAYIEIGKACLADPVIYSATSTHFTTTTFIDANGVEQGKWLFNTNEIMNPDNQYNRYRANCVGLKTGSSSQAGGCLLAAYEVEGRYILVGVFGCYDYGRFGDANRLYDYFFPGQG